MENPTTRTVWLRSLPLLAAPFLVLFAITQQTEIPWRYFFTDLPVALQVPIFSCVVTSSCTVLWCSSGLVAIFASNFTSPEGRRSLLWLGFFSICLGIDDLIMLHETLLPRALGLTGKYQGQAVEMTVFGLYGIIMAAWLWSYRSSISRVVKPYLFGSLFCFAFSLAADFASAFKLFGRWSRFRTDYDFQMLIEDGPKFIGVVLWSIFVWHYSRGRLSDDAN